MGWEVSGRGNIELHNCVSKGRPNLSKSIGLPRSLPPHPNFDNSLPRPSFLCVAIFITKTVHILVLSLVELLEGDGRIEGDRNWAGENSIAICVYARLTSGAVELQQINRAEYFLFLFLQL